MSEKGILGPTPAARAANTEIMLQNAVVAIVERADKDMASEAAADPYVPAFLAEVHRRVARIYEDRALALLEDDE